MDKIYLRTCPQFKFKLMHHVGNMPLDANYVQRSKTQYVQASDARLRQKKAVNQFASHDQGLKMSCKMIDGIRE